MKRVSNKKKGLPMSFLKSLLQKAVRRSEPKVAMKAAKLLIKADERQFLRRWLVVSLEDGFLHPKFGKAATILRNDQFPLTKNQREWLINMVAELSGGEWRDNWVNEHEGVTETIEEKQARDKRGDNVARWKELEENELEILQGIRYRASVGGMKGDVTMLWNYYFIWLDRFLNKGWSVSKLNQYFTPSSHSYISIPKLKREDVILEAVDMHCSPLIPILLKKDFVRKLLENHFPNQLDYEQTLKDLLWRQMSSVSSKKAVGDGKPRDWYEKGKGANADKTAEERIWEQIKSETKSIQMWFIKNLFIKVEDRKGTLL